MHVYKLTPLYSDNDKHKNILCNKVIKQYLEMQEKRFNAFKLAIKNEYYILSWFK